MLLAPLRFAALIALTALALVGCSPDPYPGEEGEILHVGLRLLPKSFDPPDIGEEGSGKVSAPVYEGLLAYHPYARPYQLVPALAESMPVVSEDRMSWTIRLKEGVTFVDDPCFPDGQGREVTAEDVLYAFKRFSHPSTHAKGWWLFDRKVAGLNAWRDGLKADIAAASAAGEPVGPLWGLEREVAGFEVVDRYTFRVNLAEPYPQFAWVLAMSYTFIYPHEAVEHYGEEFRNHPVGTGPYRLKEYNPVYRAVYEPNLEYRENRVPDPRNNPADRLEGWDWEQDERDGYLVNAGAKLPLLDGIETRFILEDQPRWLYFKSGYLDFMNPPKDNTAEAIPMGELSGELKERGVRLYPWTELGTVYSCLNTEDALLSNVGVRRAVALAFDHKWTVDHLYAGQAIVANSLIPPGVAGYADYHPYHSDDGTARYDEARQMLADAGYPDGIDPATGKQLRLRFENSGTSLSARHFAARFVDEMRRIGIEVDVIVNTFPQMTEKMRNGSFQVAGLAWGFDYPDAQNIFQLLYSGNADHGSNSANFRDDTFDALYEASSVMEHGPERTAIYEDMAKIVADEVPWITRTHRIRQNLQQPWLQGFKYTETSDNYWHYLGVDAEARRASLAEWNQPVRWPLAVFGGGFALLVGATILRSRQ